MQVYKIKLDTSFQRFIPIDEAVWSTGLLKMDCHKKLSDWQGLDVYNFNPKRKRGDFSHLCSGGFVVEPRVYRLLQTPFEIAAEALPIRCDGEELLLINIIECVNALNVDESRFKINSDETINRCFPIEYVFHSRRMTQSSLFKIPESSLTEIFYVSDMVEEEEDFKLVTEQQKLSGIRFELVWSQ